MSDPTAVVTGAYEAFGRRDLAAILGSLDESVRWRAPEVLPQGGVYNGRDNVEGFFRKIMESFDGLEVDVDEPISSGARVAVTGRARGTLKATGKDIRYPFAHVWTIENGRATAFDEYVDPAELLS